MANNKSKAEQNATLGKSFVLNDAELETLQSTRGRREEESVYKSQVQNAYDTGDVCGISLTDTVKGPWVQAQLRKAARQLWGKDAGNKMISVFDRSENKSADHPHGFVAFKVTKSESDSTAN